MVSTLRALFALVAVRAQARLCRLLATIEDRSSVHASIPLGPAHIVDADGTVTPVPAEYLEPWRQA